MSDIEKKNEIKKIISKDKIESTDKPAALQKAPRMPRQGRVAKTEKLPMLPLRGMLVFPYMVIHLDVGRSKSINAIEAALESYDSLIFLSMQKDPQIDDPMEDQVFRIGSVARVRQSLKLPGGTIRVLIECLYRAELVTYEQNEPYLLSKIRLQQETLDAGDSELEAMMRILGGRFEEYARNDKRISPDTLVSLNNIEDPSHFADLLATCLNLKLSDKQLLLDEFSIAKRLEMLIQMLGKEMDILELERKIAGKVREQMEKSQKEYYLERSSSPVC